MRHKTFLVLLLSSSLCTCTQNEKQFGGAHVKLKTTREKFSYALGYDFGPSMKHIKSGVELRYFMAGLEDYFNERPALLNERERQDVRSEEFTRIGEEYLQNQKMSEQKRLEEGEAFLAANQKREGISTTASGLQYQVLSEGSGPQPGPDDRIKIKFRGTFIDGKEFENTDKLEKGYSTCLVKGVMPGWSEAFQLMRVGGKYRIFIPSKLAYGKIGREPDIPANAALIYDLEIVEILNESNSE